MANSYLTQQISQFLGTNIPVTYVRPLAKNLASGTYISEIKDIQEVIDANGNFEALDFYHQLTDSNGNVTHVRFRYYEKELPALASSLKQYPKVKTWQNAVGLQEEVTVAPKPSGSYLHIAARKAITSNVSQTSSGASLTSSQTTKRVGISPKLGSKHGNLSSQASKAYLVSTNKNFDDWDDDEEVDDDYLTEED